MSHKMRSLMIGMAAGALLGAAFAWVASDGNGDGESDAITAVKQLGPMDYFGLGIAILTLGRKISGMLKKA